MSDAANWFSVGHITHEADRTGCTAIVFDRLSPAVVDVRGGAPASRETDLLGSGRLVGQANAFLLTGGSAFGLSAADGVMRFLAERGQGFATAAGPVPIVPAASIFDLANRTARVPTADDGFEAARRATSGLLDYGQIGAGAGATVAKLGGVPLAGGLGNASVAIGGTRITAIIALNAVGDIRDPDTGAWLARAANASGETIGGRQLAIRSLTATRVGENTSIGALLIDRPVSRDTLLRCCVAAHDALARCVVPAHTIFDGDLFFAAAPAEADTPPRDILAMSAAIEIAVERAIVGLFRADR